MRKERRASLSIGGVEGEGRENEQTEENPSSHWATPAAIFRRPAATVISGAARQSPRSTNPPAEESRAAFRDRVLCDPVRQPARTVRRVAERCGSPHDAKAAARQRADA